MARRKRARLTVGWALESERRAGNKRRAGLGLSLPATMTKAAFRKAKRLVRGGR